MYSQGKEICPQNAPEPLLKEGIIVSLHTLSDSTLRCVKNKDSLCLLEHLSYLLFPVVIERRWGRGGKPRQKMYYTTVGCTLQAKTLSLPSVMFTSRDLFKKIRDTKGTFHANMGSIKDRNGMDLKKQKI